MHEEFAVSDEVPSLNRVKWTLKRNAALILICLMGGIALAYGFISVVPPKYKASVDLLFDPGLDQVMSPDGGMATITTLKALERAVALIQSPATLRDVVEAIDKDPSVLRPKTVLSTIFAQTQASTELRLRRMVTLLQAGLSVDTQASDQIISVQFTSSNPEEAAAVANLIVAKFIENRANARKDALKLVKAWLDQQVADAKDKLIAVDKKIESFKAEQGIDSDERGTASLDGELSRFKEQLATIQGRIGETEGRLLALGIYETDTNLDYWKIAEKLSDPSLEKLRTSLAEAEGKYAALKVKLGAYHPDVQDRQAEVQALRQQLQAEARRVVLSARADIESWKKREIELLAKISSLESNIKKIRASEVELREFQRERGAIKTLYEGMLTKLTQTVAHEALAVSEFKLLMTAAPPENPKLNPILVLIGGGLLGLCGGIVLSLGLDFLSSKLVHIDQIEKRLPAAVIAKVPALTGRDFSRAAWKTRKTAAERFLHFVEDHPHSLFADALLGAKVAVSGVNNTRRSNVVMLTSAMPGEGKTQMTSNLASLTAILGEKTLLIDFDIRKHSAITARMNGSRNSELSELLAQANIEGFHTAPTADQAFDIIRPARTEQAVWRTLFQPQMHELLALARTNYKQVWIDTPPALLFPDALALCAEVDAVILVAEWARTSMKQVRETAAMIQRAGGNLIGIIINKIKVDPLIYEPMVSYQYYYKGSDEVGA